MSSKSNKLNPQQQEVIEEKGLGPRLSGDHSFESPSKEACQRFLLYLSALNLYMLFRLLVMTQKPECC